MYSGELTIGGVIEGDGFEDYPTEGKKYKPNITYYVRVSKHRHSYRISCLIEDLPSEEERPKDGEHWRFDIVKKPRNYTGKSGIGTSYSGKVLGRVNG